MSLHPAGAAGSIAYSAHNGRQIGYADVLGQPQASLLAGNIGSWLSLHPAGGVSSTGFGIYGDHQCGWVDVNGNRAAIWTGTARSWVDLHPFVGAEFNASGAADVWEGSGFVYIVGDGTHDVTGRREALMWVSRLLTPLSFMTIRGIVTTGNLQSLGSSDNDRLTWRPGIVFSSQQAPVEVRFDAVANSASPNGLSFSVESSASFGNAQQSILLWNYQSGAYETLDTKVVALEDDVYRVTVSSNAARFVEPGTLAVRGSIAVRAIGPSFAYPWTYKIDKVWWNFPG